MKTKILVSSDSGIDYMSHPYSVQSLPSLIKFFDIEKYFDFIDMSAEKFFNRLRYDSKVKPEIVPMDLEFIQNDINIALESYDNVLIIVSNFLDYTLLFNELKNVYQEQINFYKTDATGYILSTMAIECDKALKENKSFDEAFKLMENIYNNSAMLILNPLVDISISENVDEDKRVEEKRKSRLVIVEPQNEIEIKDRDRDFIVSMIKQYLDRVAEEYVMPFIMYSSKYSYYLKLIESKLLIIHKRYKSIKKIPASPNLGMKYGSNIVIIGYIKNLS